jgi:hypothetical protein
VVAAITLAAFVIMMGCNSHGPTGQSPSAPAVEMPSFAPSDVLIEEYSLGGYQVDLPIAPVALHTARTYHGDTGEEACLEVDYSYMLREVQMTRTLRFVTVESFPPSIGLEVVDSEGTSRYGLATEFHSEDLDSITLTEWAGNDTLTMCGVFSDSSLTTSFHLKGDVLSFTAALDAPERIHFYGVGQEAVGKPTSAQPSYSEMKQAFKDFYFGQAGELESSADGMLMAELLASPEFEQVLVDSLGWHLGDEQFYLWGPKAVCGVVGAISTFKCLLGGFLINPICHAGIVTVGVCVLLGYAW